MLPLHGASRRYRRRLLNCLIIGLGQLVATMCGPTSWAGDLIEEDGYFRVEIDGRPVRLQGLIVKRTDATKPLPIALITHGKPPNEGSMLDMRPSGLAGTARDLAQRGWLAVVVMRRGFGQSDGPLPAQMTCMDTSFSKRFAADADELQATLEFVGRRPDADATRAIAIGVSAGGAAVSALAARNPKGLLGVVNISGGLRFTSCSKEDALVAVFREFGKDNRVPSLWLYAHNDSVFPPALVDRMRSAFLDEGGDAKLVMYEAVGNDGHSLFSYARSRWLLEMDGFLRSHELPTWRRQDANLLLQRLQSNNVYLVDRYLSAATEKALAKSTSNEHWTFATASSVALARAYALDACHSRRLGELCTIVMENDRWLDSESTNFSTAQRTNVPTSQGG